MRSKNKASFHKEIYYTFNFVSLIAPNLVGLNTSNKDCIAATSGQSSKILLKQSYLIFTWFYYLKRRAAGSDRGSSLVKFSFLPTKSRFFTLTKAPMAHKTNSKEQFVFNFFKLKATFVLKIPQPLIPSSVNRAVLALLLIRTSFPVFETNLLLLKASTISIPFRDPLFLKY